MSKLGQRIDGMKRANAKTLLKVKAQKKIVEKRKAILERKSRAMQKTRDSLATAKRGQKKAYSEMKEGQKLSKEIDAKKRLVAQIEADIKKKQLGQKGTNYQVAKAEVIGVEIAQLEKAFKKWANKIDVIKTNISHYNELVSRRSTELKKLA